MKVYPFILHDEILSITLTPSLERLISKIEASPDGINIEELAKKSGRNREELGIHLKILKQKGLIYSDSDVNESGTISLDIFCDKLQSYAINRQSGILRVKNKSKFGALYFDGGHLLDVRYDRMYGDQAFYKLFCEAENIAYAFVPDKRPMYIRPTITKEIQFLIMEALQLRDEMRKVGT